MIADFWKIFEQGGIMMWPLMLFSFAAVTVIIERTISLQRKRILKTEIITVLEQVKQEADLPLAKSVCQKSRGPFSNIIMLCIENRDLPADDLRLTVEDEGRQQVRNLSRGMSILETVAAVAPLLGLLGTVLGMIEVFDVIEQLGVGQAKALSGGISKALITTATGLFVGIPALIAYNFFSARIEGFILDIEKFTLMFLTKLLRMKSSDAQLDSLKLRSE